MKSVRHQISQLACEFSNMVYLTPMICETSQDTNRRNLPNRASPRPATGGNVVPMKSSRAYGSVSEKVPHNLRAIRQARGWSMELLAEKMNVATPTIQRWETEPQRLRVSQLSELAAVLECSVIDLIDTDPARSMRERELIEALRDMSREDRERVLTIIDALTAKLKFA